MHTNNVLLEMFSPHYLLLEIIHINNVILENGLTNIFIWDHAH